MIDIRPAGQPLVLLSMVSAAPRLSTEEQYLPGSYFCIRAKLVGRERHRRNIIPIKSIRRDRPASITERISSSFPIPPISELGDEESPYSYVAAAIQEK